MADWVVMQQPKPLATRATQVSTSSTSCATSSRAPSRAKAAVTSCARPGRGALGYRIIGTPLSSRRPIWARPHSGWVSGRPTTSGSRSTTCTPRPGSACTSRLKPTAMRRSRSACSCSALVMLFSSRRTSGRWRWKSASSRGMTSSTPEPKMPTSRRPISPAPASRVRSSARWASDRMLGTSSSSVWPAAVSSTPLGVRRNSAVPSSSSSARICRVSGGWAMCSRCAARPKCSSWARAKKYFICRKSMGTPVFHTSEVLISQNSVLDSMKTAAYRCPHRCEDNVTMGPVPACRPAPPTCRKERVTC
uniref:Hypothetical CdoX3 n=1 Tax=Comamonas sp. JS765 TaxID=58226 RepID=Q9F9I7_9BURK|nr:hypothetical CdoX3 [Comamonas sp. JS765]